MSTPGADYDDSLEPKQYFCYECNRNVGISACAAATGDLSCPVCRGRFLEEVTDATPSIHAFPFALMPSASSPPRSSESSSAAPPSSHLSNFITNFLNLQDAPRARSSSGRGAASPAGTATPDNEPGSFDPLVFFRNYIRGLEEGGANVHLLLDGARVDLHPDSFQDYLHGLGLEQLMEHIADNHPNRRGAPPASKAALSTLHDGVLTMVEAEEGTECAVCSEVLSPWDEAKRMPCKHIFHTDCIIHWLGLHNSCPICRFQLYDPSIATPLSSITTEEGAGRNARVPRQSGNNMGAGSNGQDRGSSNS